MGRELPRRRASVRNWAGHRIKNTMSFRKGLSGFGNRFGTLPCPSVGARASIQPLGSSQQRLIGIEYDLSCALRCGQVEVGFRTVGEYLA
jgi:hypothetical protein